MQKSFNEYLKRKSKEYGDNFSDSGLAKQFIPYYESQERIEVDFTSLDGEVYETKRGTIGVTTGWVPCFILMLTKRSSGSSYTLRERDKIKKTTI